METATTYATQGKEATPAVLEIGQLAFSGNVIPHTWYQHLVKEKKHRAGNDEVNTHTYPYLEAITILGDICYWYRPREIRDEDTGHVIRRERRFRADKLQRSYDQYGDLFGLSKEQARDALKWLENKGLITLELRTVSTKMGPIHNVLFIEPVPAEIARLNRPAIECQLTHTPLSVDPLSEPQLTDTYTEITTEITTEEPPAVGDSSPQVNPAEAYKERLRSRLGGDPLAVAATTKAKREQLAHPDWTDATKDVDAWADGPVDEWCKLIGLPADIPASRRTYFARQLELLAGEVQATPMQTGTAIRKIAGDKRYSWLRSAGSPKHRGFAEVLQNVLCGLDTEPDPDIHGMSADMVMI